MNNLRKSSDNGVEYALDLIPKKVLFRIFKFILQILNINTIPDIFILYFSRGIFAVAVFIGIIFAIIALLDNEGYDNPITPTKEAMMNLNQYKKNKRNTKMKK